MTEDTLIKCHYCSEQGAYWDSAEKQIISVCKKHLNMESTS